MSKRTRKHALELAALFLFSAISLAGAQTNNGLSPANPYGLNTNFNPSLAIIIVVLISVFFFMGFFSIYIRQCAGEARNGGSIRRPATGRSRRGALGLDPAVIETFPTFLYSDVKGLKIGKGALECAVCLNEFEDDETLRLLPKCDHVFHPECIDAWLGSHTTCPVCRANLEPESGQAESAAATASTNVPDSDSGSDDENRASEIDNAQDQVAIRVVSSDDQIASRENSQPDVIIPGQNRPARSSSMSMKRRIAGKFPRSHSTGHSLVQPGENCERFTLRLPEEVRKQIVNGKLSRVKSCVSFPVGDGSVTGGSSRRGYRGSAGEGSSRGRSLQFWRTEQGARSDRWVFSKTPPFFTRTASVKAPKIIDGEGSGHGNSRNLLTSVKTPFDCIGSKAGAGEESSARSPV